MTVIVYSRPGCQPCRITKQALQAKGVEFEEIDISVDQEAFAFVTQELAYSSVPVVFADAGQHWSGYQPDRIKALVVNRDPQAV